MTTPPPTARPIKGDEQPWKPKDFEQLAHGAIGCLFEFSGHAHLGGFDVKELELRAKEYSAHADALSPQPSPQPTQQAGETKRPKLLISGETARIIIKNAHVLLRHKFRGMVLWSLVSDITGHGSGYSAQVCESANLDPFQKCGVGGLKDLPPATQEGGTKK